eukprot:5458337-Pyramimonas_sp.AAC.1
MPAGAGAAASAGGPSPPSTSTATFPQACWSSIARHAATAGPFEAQRLLPVGDPPSSFNLRSSSSA